MLPPIQLLTDWPAGDDPAGWWLSEKLDGIRVYWDGATLWSRGGVPLEAPAWFTSGLPAVALDGELYARGLPCATVSGIARSLSPSQALRWARLRFHVFDSPGPGEIEVRLETLAGLNLGPWAERVDHRRCGGRADMEAALRAVLATGGEGVVLRRPGSLYTPGRTRDVRRRKHAAAEWAGAGYAC